MADPELITPKTKLVIHTKVFVDFYNWKNCGQAYEICMIIELEKMNALTAKNPCNLGTSWIIDISSVLYSAYMVCKDQDKFVFYVNNYIDSNQFN